MPHNNYDTALGQVDKWYGQIVWSPFPYSITSYGGGGLPQKGEGESSGLNDKPDNDGQPYLTILYTNQGFQIKFWLDAMNNPRKNISGDSALAPSVSTPY